MTDSRRKDDGVATDGVAPDSVTLAETVRVSQSRAFELFTEHVSDWYLIGQHTVPNFERAVRLRFEGPGGRFLAVTDPDTGDGDVLGEIEAWNPPASLTFIDHRRCHVSVEFRPEGDATQVTITVSGIHQLDPEVAETVSRHSWHTIIRWYAPFVHRQVSDMTAVPTFEGVTPNLRYEDAGAAIDWLVRVCGFEERARYVDAKDIVRQAEVFVGDTEVWLSGHGAGYWDNEPAGRGPEQYLVIWVDDVDAQWERVRATGVDAPEPQNQDYGVRNFYVTDPEGYHWGFHSRLASGYQPTKTVEEGGLREIMKANR